MGGVLPNEGDIPSSHPTLILSSPPF